MQSVFNVGNLVRVNPKGQTRLWVVLVGLLFSSLLLGQRVNVIDQKGTKASTGVEYTESATQPASPIEGDLWKNTTDGLLYVYEKAGGTWVKANDLALNDLNDVNTPIPAENDVLSYDISSLTWVNKSLRELKTIEVVNENNAYNESNPLLIGLVNYNPLDGGSTSSGRFKSPDNADIYIIDKSNAQVYVVLGPLNANYDGKIIRIVEADNENPKITLYDGDETDEYKEFFDLSEKNFSKDNELFIGAVRDVYDIGASGGIANLRTYYMINESVDFIWVNDENKWIPMR